MKNNKNSPTVHLVFPYWPLLCMIWNCSFSIIIFTVPWSFEACHLPGDIMFLSAGLLCWFWVWTWSTLRGGAVGWTGWSWSRVPIEMDPELKSLDVGYSISCLMGSDPLLTVLWGLSVHSYLLANRLGCLSPGEAVPPSSPDLYSGPVGETLSSLTCCCGGPVRETSSSPAWSVLSDSSVGLLLYSSGLGDTKIFYLRLWVL